MHKDKSIYQCKECTRWYVKKLDSCLTCGSLELTEVKPAYEIRKKVDISLFEGYKVLCASTKVKTIRKKCKVVGTVCRYLVLTATVIEPDTYVCKKLLENGWELASGKGGYAWFLDKGFIPLDSDNSPIQIHKEINLEEV